MSLQTLKHSAVHHAVASESLCKGPGVLLMDQRMLGTPCLIRDSTDMQGVETGTCTSCYHKPRDGGVVTQQQLKAVN